jgi:hypothetical protein
MKRMSSVVSALGLVVATLAAPSAWANVSGAIYTSLLDGSEVNFNIYGSKADVYLNGGPGKGAGTNAAGLAPDGRYIFMVTSPDGQLLSTDIASCRQVHVIGGLVRGIALPEATDPACPALHLNGAPSPQAGGATAVQLLPYSDTPNPGGEYKAWLTPKASFACDMDEVTCANGRHGFINSESKTDNFKVGSVADEIDTRFWFNGQPLDNRAVTWFDTHGASNTKWSYFDPSRWIMHEAHVEAPEIGTHYISIANQPGCAVGDVYVDGVKSRKRGPQTVPVKITKGMKSKGTFTVWVDVYCTSIQ